MASSMPRRFPPSFPVTPPKACAALWYKRRRGDTELCGALAGCPLSRLAATASRLPPRVLSASGRRPAPTDAAAETGRWATSHRDVAAPKGGAKSRLPLWGALVPGGHRSALDRAGRREWTRVSEDGEGKLPASPSAPVAIALTGACAPGAGFFLAAAHKVKFKVEAFLKKSFTKKLYSLRAAFSYSPSVHLRISSKNAWPYFCSLAWPTPGTSSSSAGVRGW